MALKFGGTSLAPRVWAKKRSCACLSPVSQGTPHTRLLSLGVLRMPVSCLSGYTHSCILSRWEPAQSVAAETGGGVNFENNPCCNVMNQEAGILHQLFMQIFGCSLSSSTWKEWVLKLGFIVELSLTPFLPQNGPFVDLPRLSPPGMFTISYVILSRCSWVHFLLCSKNTKKVSSL